MKRPTWSIGTRLLLAQAMVLIAGFATAGLVASLVGPVLFHDHMLATDHTPTAAELQHVENAYQIASATSLGLALAAASGAALLVSWYLTRRFQTPLVSLTRAAAHVSTGRYDVRVPADGAGPEIDSLATAFNTMAAQLQHIEDTRRSLLSDLAHELRTPIATLNAYLEGVHDGVTPWNPSTQHILEDQVDRLTRLADDIDAVSRAQERRFLLDRTTVNVDELVAAAILARTTGFQKKAVRLTNAGGPCSTVTVDRTRLLQVLSNLLDNALRHTPPGGLVTLAWHEDHGGVALSVVDTGDGIPAGQLGHVFERFYRGDTARDREHHGSGIGLTISKAIIEAHDGRLDVWSDGPGAGATFRLTLPAEDPTRR